MTTREGEPDEDRSKVFVAADSDHADYSGVFEDDGEAGDLYIYDRPNRAILRLLRIYDASGRLGVTADDVEVVWSEDGSRCGVAIWGGMRGIIDLRHGRHALSRLEHRSSVAIADVEWLSGFSARWPVAREVSAQMPTDDTPITAVEAATDRGRHWRRVAAALDAGSPDGEGSREPASAAPEVAELFVAASGGPPPFAAFFEDNGETGDLYVSNRATHQIVRHVQVYTTSGALNVTERDVQVVWSDDGMKCGVVIWDGLRAIIDFANGFSGREFIADRNTRPISDPGWLRGFDWHAASKGPGKP